MTGWVKANKAQDATTILTTIEASWNKWIYQPGLPPVTPDFSSPLITAAKNLAQAFIDAKGAAPAGQEAYHDYLANQKYVFYEYLILNEA